MELGKGLEHRSDEKQPREPGSPSPEKRKPGGTPPLSTTPRKDAADRWGLVPS